MPCAKAVWLKPATNPSATKAAARLLERICGVVRLLLQRSRVESDFVTDRTRGAKSAPAETEPISSGVLFSFMGMAESGTSKPEVGPVITTGPSPACPGKIGKTPGNCPMAAGWAAHRGDRSSERWERWSTAGRVQHSPARNFPAKQTILARNLFRSVGQTVVSAGRSGSSLAGRPSPTIRAPRQTVPRETQSAGRRDEPRHLESRSG